MTRLDEILDIEELHKQACLEGKSSVAFPGFRFMTFTRDFLLKQGKCCGNKCMFCPYGHANVRDHICSKEECKFVTK